MEKPENVERKWYIVDATGMPLGRLASQVADILTGKNKPSYTPHVDTGDHVIVINSDKAVLTGKKLTNKMLTLMYEAGQIAEKEGIANHKRIYECTFRL